MVKISNYLLCFVGPYRLSRLTGIGKCLNALLSLFLHSMFSATLRLFLSELPHLQDSFVDKLLELMPRLSSCKPVELVKILQTTLRQSSLLQLRLPEQVY